MSKNSSSLRAAAKEKEAPEPKRLSVGTQANRLAAVRKFFSWLLSEQQIAYDPATTLQLPKQPQRLPRGVLTKTEARRLIEATPTTKTRDIRDRAILETLYATGIRRAELIALTIYDADLQTATLGIEHGKGNTKRVVPLTQLAFPRKEQPLPHVLNESDIARLIETPDTTTALGLRDRALMEVLYATGIRHCEAHKLDLYDVDTAALRLTVQLGKGQRDRVVPLTETAAYWLTRYLTAARPELAAGLWWGKGRRRTRDRANQDMSYAGDDRKNSLEAKYGPGFLRPTQRKPLLAQSPSLSDTQSRSGPSWSAATPALWLSVTSRRLSYQMIGDRIRDYALQAEVKASVHTFRHCCATHLLRGGASVRHVQQLLGHRDLNSTEIYTHLELEDLKRTIESAASAKAIE